DHAQGSLDLMQAGNAQAHLLDPGRLLDIRLECDARVLEGLVEFGLDPVQRGEIDVVLQFHVPRPRFPNARSGSSGRCRRRTCAASEKQGGNAAHIILPSFPGRTIDPTHLYPADENRLASWLPLRATQECIAWRYCGSLKSATE